MKLKTFKEFIAEAKEPKDLYNPGTKFLGEITVDKWNDKLVYIYDKGVVSDDIAEDLGIINLNSDDLIVRYVTFTTSAGKMSPLAKLNLSKNQFSTFKDINDLSKGFNSPMKITYKDIEIN